MAGRDQVRCPQCGVPVDSGALFCSRCGASQNRPGYQGRRHGRVTLAGATMALACLIGLAVLVFVLYMIVSHAMVPSVDANSTSTAYSGAAGTMATLNTPTTAPATTSTTSGSTVKGSLLVRPQAATGSSSLESTNLTDFRPTNLVDGDVSTAWVEGAKGTGAGEWVKYEFEKPITVARIEIANGFQTDEETFANYVRVKSLQVDYSDGTRQVVQLQDKLGLQVIEPQDLAQVQWIKLTVLTLYPSYKWPQAAMSEARVYEVVQ